MISACFLRQPGKYFLKYLTHYLYSNEAVNDHDEKRAVAKRYFYFYPGKNLSFFLKDWNMY